MRPSPTKSAPLRETNVRCLFRRWCRAVPKCEPHLRMRGTLRDGREGKTPRAKLGDTPPAHRPGPRSGPGWTGYDTGRSLSPYEATAFLPDRPVRCAAILRMRLWYRGWWVGLVAGRPSRSCEWIVVCVLRLCLRMFCRYRLAVRPNGGYYR